MPQNMTLEELGLLQLLERISEEPGAAIDRFARYGLAQGGYITATDPPTLTDAGTTRLAQLRQARDASAGETLETMAAPEPETEPDPGLA